MRKEFESGLAKRVADKKSERKMLGKAWLALVLGAAVIAVSAVSVSAIGAMNGYQTGDMDGEPDQDQLRDGSCEEETLVDSDGDGICDAICDCTCDCTCDCPCTDVTP